MYYVENAVSKSFKKLDFFKVVFTFLRPITQAFVLSFTKSREFVSCFLFPVKHKIKMNHRELGQELQGAKYKMKCMSVHNTFKQGSRCGFIIGRDQFSPEPPAPLNTLSTPTYLVGTCPHPLHPYSNLILLRVLFWKSFVNYFYSFLWRNTASLTTQTVVRPNHNLRLWNMWTDTQRSALLSDSIDLSSDSAQTSETTMRSNFCFSLGVNGLSRIQVTISICSILTLFILGSPRKLCGPNPPLFLTLEISSQYETYIQTWVSLHDGINKYTST